MTECDIVMNPGSPEAEAAGCTCPVGINNCGRTPPLPGWSWWITFDCPLHHAWRTQDMPDEKTEPRG